MIPAVDSAGHPVCVNCGQPVSFWRDEGWMHDDYQKDRPFCENPEGSVLR